MVRAIRNPFVGIEGYSCFGCSPGNEFGLRMAFAEEGEEIVCSWSPEKHYAGYGGILHGGIQAALHDEIASWLVMTKLATAGFTRRLETDYSNPVRIDLGKIELRSRLDRVEGGNAYVRTELRDGKGSLCSSSLAVIFVLPQHIAKRRLAYPADPAAFFE